MGGNTVDLSEHKQRHKENLKHATKQYLESLHHTVECPACHSLMPHSAHFCYMCGEAMSMFHTSLLAKITRQLWLVAGISAMSAVVLVLLVTGIFQHTLYTAISNDILANRAINQELISHIQK